MAKFNVNEIRTAEEIEAIALSCSGTHVRRNNVRKLLTEASNDLVDEQISICKGKIRDLRAMGAREQALRDWYAEVTKYELMLLEI